MGKKLTPGKKMLRDAITSTYDLEEIIELKVGDVVFDNLYKIIKTVREDKSGKGFWCVSIDNHPAYSCYELTLEELLKRNDQSLYKMVSIFELAGREYKS